MSKHETYRRWHRRQRHPPREMFRSGIAVTTSRGQATVRDARTRITLERINEVSARLHVPVTFRCDQEQADVVDGIQPACGRNAPFRSSPRFRRWGQAGGAQFGPPQYRRVLVSA